MNILLTIIILLLTILVILLNYLRLQKTLLLNKTRELEQVTRLLEASCTRPPNPHQVETVLQDQLHFLETLFQAIPNPIFYKDQQGRYLGCNKAFEEATGYQNNAIIGKTAFDLWPTEHANHYHTEELKLLNHPGVQIYETLARYADGNYHHLLIHQATYTNSAGEISGLIAISTDITKHQQLKERLQDSETKFRRLFEEADDPYLLLEETKIIDCNRATVKILGYTSKKQILHLTPAALSPDRQPDGCLSSEKMADMMAIAFQTGSHRFEWVQRRANGENFHVEALFTTIFMPTRPLLYVSWRDISARKHTEARLQQRTNELILINRVSQLFSSTLELEEVLQIILGEISRLLAITGTSFWWLLPDTGELVCQQMIGPKNDKVIGFRLAPGQGIAGHAAQSGKPLIIPDTTLDKRHFKGVDAQTGVSIRSILSVPLLSQERVIGVLNLVDTSVNRFTTENLRLVEPIAIAAANAIENANLYTKVQQELRERQRAETALAKKEDYLATLVEIQQCLLAFGSDNAYLTNLNRLNYESNYFPYSEILELLGTVSQASHIYLFENHPRVKTTASANNESTNKTSYEWYAQDFTTSVNNTQWSELPYEKLMKRWYNQLERGETLTGTVTDWPAEEQQLLQERGILSLLVLPLVAAGKLFGFVGFDNCREPRPWEAAEISLLQAAAAAISLTKERQQIETVLIQSQRRFATVLDSIDAAIYVADMKTYELLFLNKHLHDLLGDVEGQLCWQTLRVGRTNVCEFCTNPHLVTADGQPTGIYSWEYYDDHQQKWHNIQNQAIPWVDGRLVRLEIATDITNRKQHEVQLQQANLELNRFKTTLDLTLDSVFIFDADTLNFFYVNQGAINQLGYTQTELLQRGALDLNPPTLEEEYSQALMTLLVENSQKPAITFETWHQHKDGNLIPVEVFAQYIQLSDQQKYFIAIARDITERKQTEAKLQQARILAEEARQTAEQANQAKSVFLAHMSHELRTPLNGILGYTQILSTDQTLTDQQYQGIQIIHRSGEHLLTLINDILDFSKIEAGKLELKSVDFRFPEFLQSIIDLFKLRAEQKNITLNCQLTATIPLTVYADEKRLRQILLNLLSNAIKFTPPGGQVCLQVSSQESKTRFAIEDNGEGIAAEQLTAIFLPFHQAGNSNYHAEGTGLGLPISKKLVEAMGGQLQVISQLGKGSLFWFEIPLYQDQYTENLLHLSPLTVLQPVANTPPLPLMVGPAPELIADLLQLVTIGDIDGIFEQATQLEQQNASFSLFSAEIKQFTLTFELNKLENFLKQFL